MKFLALREAIEAVSERPVKESPAAPIPPTPPPCLPSKAEVHRVVHGIVKWKPIDRVAARVTAKANWLSMPPYPEPFSPAKQMNIETAKKQNVSQFSAVARGIENPITGEPLISVDDAQLIAAEIHQARMLDLKKRADEILVAMETSMRSIEEAFRDTGPTINDRISLLRSARMSIVTEISLMLPQLRDLRTFFFEDQHRREIERLQEFISLCEKLKALKADGTLDAVCDVSLRLAVGSPQGS